MRFLAITKAEGGYAIINGPVHSVKVTMAFEEIPGGFPSCSKLSPCLRRRSLCFVLYIISLLRFATIETSKEAVAPTSLRIALSTLYPESNFFQQAQMNDASEVLAVVFDGLHRVFTSIGGCKGF